MRRTLGLFGIAVMTMAACSSESRTSATPPATINVTATNYTFAAPATVPSGAVLVTLTNNGKEAHQAQLFKLNNGTDLGKLVAAGKVASPDLALDKLGAYLGGPDAVDPGETQVATSRLAPGNYAFICVLPDAKGRSHLSLGMVSPLTVTANGSGAALPPAAANASTRDFGFQLPQAWTGRIAVTNNGRQPHEFQILGIAPGKTPADLEKSFKSQTGTETGPPPWTADGGLSAIAPGQRQEFDIALKPGTYYLMCFVTDPQRKVPHFALGMMKRFEVK